jgi:hypothetical protein
MVLGEASQDPQSPQCLLPALRSLVVTTDDEQVHLPFLSACPWPALTALRLPVPTIRVRGPALRLLLLSLPRLLHLRSDDDLVARKRSHDLAQQIEPAFAEDRASRRGQPRVLVLQRLERDETDVGLFDGLEAPALASVTIRTARFDPNATALCVARAMSQLPLLPELRLQPRVAQGLSESSLAAALQACGRSAHKRLRSIVVEADEFFDMAPYHFDESAAASLRAVAEGLAALTTIAVERAEQLPNGDGEAIAAGSLWPRCGLRREFFVTERRAVAAGSCDRAGEMSGPPKLKVTIVPAPLRSRR